MKTAFCAYYENAVEKHASRLGENTTLGENLRSKNRLPLLRKGEKMEDSKKTHHKTVEPTSQSHCI